MIGILVAAVAAGLAVATYAAVERTTGRMVPAAFRAVAWASVALLLVNPSCPVAGPAQTPIVLLDGSLSMAAAGGRWAEARALATSLGDARLFGDPDAVLDSLPVAGTSRLAPALTAAAVSERPVIVISDGEIDDRAELPPDLRRRAEVRILPRNDAPDLAIRRVKARSRITPADTLDLEVELISSGIPMGSRVPVAIYDGRRTVATGQATLGGDGGRLTLRLPPRTLAPGEHMLSVRLTDSLDPERRDDERLHHVLVTPSPGIVLLASPPDWDSRFLARTIGDVTDLPVAAYLELEPGRWRRMSDLTAVDRAEVVRAAAGADLLIRFGRGALAPSAGRARWEWRTGSVAEEGEGDWYYEAAGPSPLSGAIEAAPLESLPPATAVSAEVLPDSAGWVGLMARQGRRGVARPVLVGKLEGGARVVHMAGQGLWRWAFRGGRGEQAYRALVASTIDWLLAAPPAEQGRIRPLSRVAEAGRALRFAWTAASEPERVAIEFTPAAGGEPVRDTLRFDAGGNAGVRLSPGLYTYAVEGRPGGLLAVETWSEEWFPRPRALESSPAAGPRPTRDRRSRDLPWVFLLAVLGFSGEWAVRRRQGLR